MYRGDSTPIRMALLSSFGKEGVKLGLLTRKADIEDTIASSKYFVISEFNPLFAAGRNSVSFNGSALLQDKSEILVECLDSQGNSLYLEQAKSQDAQFTDSAKFVVSVHVYDETYNGAGKLIIVGTTTKGEIVRWIGNITIDKTLDNKSKVRFYNKPSIEVRPLFYPVVNTDLAQVSDPPPPTATQATAHVSILSSTVYYITVTNQGSGYDASTTVALVGGGYSTQATATATLFDDKIISITVQNAGGGYLSAPVVVINGVGTGATATAYLKSEVVAIEVDDRGNGYDPLSPPAVTISGVGSGASAIAVVNGGRVTDIDVTNGGNGYISLPDVFIAVPPTAPPAELNIGVNFSGSFNTYAANPVKDTNKNSYNPKQTDLDYRLIWTGSDWRPIDPTDLESTTFPYKAFNSQMEGQTVTMHISEVQIPFSNKTAQVNVTASTTIKRVIDAKTVTLNDPIYYTSGKNQLVGQVVTGRFFVNYRFILYNTNADSYKTYTNQGQTVDVKASYADITYRNLKTFSGFVARHKLYRKSSFSPGDFQLVSDELLPANETLVDPVTFNKFYDRLGVFYNQFHVRKYWWASTDEISLQAKTFPINSMRIWRGEDTTLVDGTEYVMVKNDSIGIANDNLYYPYDADEYARLSGKSYNSNFISLKKDTLYVLSTNLSLEKEALETGAKVSFYFTSSIANIREEPGFDPNFGLKLGEVTTKDKVSIKYFDGPQTFFFTPANDYFGTLVVVPYKCNPTLSDISMKVYGDHGFSQDVVSIAIPFDVNVKNEAFDIRAELLDRDSNVVYSNLKVVQSFDADGETLYSSLTQNPVNTVIVVEDGGAQSAASPAVTIQGEPYFPDLTICDTTTRLVGWHLPSGDEYDGKLCYTNIARLFINSGDYIQLNEYQSGVEQIAKSVAVRYDFSQGWGRKVFIDAAGTKETFP